MSFDEVVKRTQASKPFRWERDCGSVKSRTFNWHQRRHCTWTLVVGQGSWHHFRPKR